MFKFLKDKIKDAAKKFSKEAEEVEEPISGETEDEKETINEENSKKETKKQEETTIEKPKKDEKKQEKEEEIDEKEETIEEPEVEEDLTEEEVSEDIDEKEEPKKEKKSFKERLKHKFAKKISNKKFEELFEELEIGLLESNVAVEVIEKIKEYLKSEIVDVPIKGKAEDFILEKLKESIEELFKEEFDLVKEIKESDKPYVILFLGVNGSGKTTTIAKVAKYLENNGISSVLAASDTFRAAAIDQLSLHGEKLKMKVIKHDYGSDPAAVAFDAIKHAKSKNIDVVLIDSAGRMHSNVNLMDELSKIVRVNTPNLKLFIGESIVGNDAIEQARAFDSKVGVDGLILTKADIDEKGGTAISISYVLDKPILFMGMGQEYKDLKKFDKKDLMDSLF